jgi:hypothetical protein
MVLGPAGALEVEQFLRRLTEKTEEVRESRHGCT